MIKVVHINDLHIGLLTDGIDRTPEIINVARDAIKRAVGLKKKGFKTYFVMGGDIFNTNTPSEKLIKAFIEGILNPLNKFDIETFIVAGNHDSVADPNRLSCLGFVKSISKTYKNIKLFENMEVVRIQSTDFGPLNFIFLPHVTRAHLEIEDRKEYFKNTQEYIEDWAKTTKDAVGKDSHNYVFSHLNVRGAHPGSEENLLKKSEAYLPEAFLHDDRGFRRPQIVQSHIHSKTSEANINIVGSQIYCGFGEAETDKHFLELSIPTAMNEKEEFKYVKTNCRKFHQLELDLTNEEWDGVSFTSLDKVKEFLRGIDKKADDIIKFDILVNPRKSSVNWDEARTDILKGTMWHV